MTSLLLWKSLLMDNALDNAVSKNEKNLLPKPTELCEDVNKCRICYQEDGEISIFNNVVHPNIAEDIYNFSGVKVEISDGLSKHMCQNCLGLLNGCIMFREMCRKTNKMIIEISIMKDNRTEWNGINQQTESDSSYGIPSPTFSDECPENSWTNREFIRNLAIKNKIPKKKLRRDEGPGLCDECGKTVLSRSLPLHKTTHRNVFPHKCDQCPYKGRTVDLLKVHKLSHLSKADLPFKCTQCPTAVTSASNLAKHMRNHERAKTKTQKHFQCHFCETGFVYKYDMTRHIKQKHMNAKRSPFECGICSIQFSSRNTLLDHQIKVHRMKKIKGRIPAYLRAQIE